MQGDSGTAIVMVEQKQLDVFPLTRYQYVLVGVYTDHRKSKYACSVLCTYVYTQFLRICNNALKPE